MAPAPHLAFQSAPFPRERPTVTIPLTSPSPYTRQIAPHPDPFSPTAPGPGRIQAPLLSLSSDPSNNPLHTVGFSAANDSISHPSPQFVAQGQRPCAVAGQHGPGGLIRACTLCLLQAVHPFSLALKQRFRPRVLQSRSSGGYSKLFWWLRSWSVVELGGKSWPPVANDGNRLGRWSNAGICRVEPVGVGGEMFNLTQ